MNICTSFKQKPNGVRIFGNESFVQRAVYRDLFFNLYRFARLILKKEARENRLSAVLYCSLQCRGSSNAILKERTINTKPFLDSIGQYVFMPD